MLGSGPVSANRTRVNPGRPIKYDRAIEGILDDARLQSRKELVTPRGGSIRRMKN